MKKILCAVILFSGSYSMAFDASKLTGKSEDVCWEAIKIAHDCLVKANLDVVPTDDYALAKMLGLAGKSKQLLDAAFKKRDGLDIENMQKLQVLKQKAASIMKANGKITLQEADEHKQNGTDTTE